MTTALDRLRTVAPPPPAGGGGRRDWAAAERALGRALPRDYKELADTYGVGGFFDHVELLVPPPTVPDGDVVTRNTSHMRVLNDLWSMHGGRPAELAGDDLLLVVWADTPDSGSLNWLVRPGEPPESWPVVVLHCDLRDCEIHPMTCTEFLAGLLARDFGSGILTHHLDEESAPFFPFPVVQPSGG